MTNTPAASGFRMVEHPNPTPADARSALIADPGFGKIFTDHMACIRWNEELGWHDAHIGPRQPIPMDPASSVLHYAQEIFEGMKAYRLDDGQTGLFRPEENARRFAASARRMAMPELPEELFLESIRQLVMTDRDWIPHSEGGSLYLRPFMFASEVFLGVRPAKEYLYLVIASPVGAYFKGGATPITVWISDQYTRAAPGGTGAAKCGGNYAASLIALGEASALGCDQVVFLDAAERKWVEELGGMNLFFLLEGKRLVTPPLSGTILPGITRDAIMTLARDEGYSVEEAPYSIDQWRDDARSGQLQECFACGTAAVITPLGTVRSRSGDFTVGNGGGGPATEHFRQRLIAIQRGQADDPHGWVKRID